MSTIMETRDLCRFFSKGEQEVKAVDKVSLTIERGKLTILKGPSGSGKTTLMNLLGCLDKPDHGSIHMEGKELQQLSSEEQDHWRRTRFGFVFQSVGILSYLSAWENLEFGLRISGIPMEEQESRITRSLNLVDMYRRRNHRGYEMSGGEQQRVAIARALSGNPDILFADEPTSALDSHLSMGMVKIFRELVEHQNMTILMTSHDPQMIEIADRVYTLRDGRIENGEMDNG